MPKATQVGKGDLNNPSQSKNEALTPIVGKCRVCGLPSLVWGYIQHGTAHVCSSACHQIYIKARSQNGQP
jgi:hypothetical protein